MSIAEILSVARSLPADEKRQLTQALVEDLANNEPEAMFKVGHVFTIYTPEFAPGTVAGLAQLLKEDTDPK